MTKQVFILGAFEVRVELSTDRLRMFCKNNNEGRFLELVDAGGHLEILAPGSITTGTGLELDAQGRAVVHPA